MAISGINSYNAGAVYRVAPQNVAFKGSEESAATTSQPTAEEPKKSSHIGAWVLGLGAVATAAYFIFRKKPAEAEDAVKEAVKEGEKIIENVVPKEGENAAKTATKISKDEAVQTAKTAFSKESADTHFQNSLIENDLKIQESELATTQTAHNAKEKEITEAFAQHDKDQAKKALDYVNSHQAVYTNPYNQGGEVGNNYAERLASMKDARAAFATKKPVIKDGLATGRLADGQEYMIQINKNGKPEQLLVGDTKVTKSRAKISKFVTANGIDLTV